MTTQVLKLTADGRPDARINMARAVALVHSGKAYIAVADETKPIRTSQGEMARPVVIALAKYYNVPLRNMKWSKKGVLARDRKCVYCGSTKDLTIDHIVSQEYCRAHSIPRNTWTNTVAACRPCNQRKDNRGLKESGMKFKDPTFTPRAPRSRSTLVLTWRDGDPEVWADYFKQYIENV